MMLFSHDPMHEYTTDIGTGVQPMLLGPPPQKAQSQPAPINPFGSQQVQQIVSNIPGVVQQPPTKPGGELPPPTVTSTGTSTGTQAQQIDKAQAPSAQVELDPEQLAHIAEQKKAAQDAANKAANAGKKDSGQANPTEGTDAPKKTGELDPEQQAQQVSAAGPAKVPPTTMAANPSTGKGKGRMASVTGGFYSGWVDEVAKPIAMSWIDNYGNVPDDEMVNSWLGQGYTFDDQGYMLNPLKYQDNTTDTVIGGGDRYKDARGYEIIDELRNPGMVKQRADKNALIDKITGGMTEVAAFLGDILVPFYGGSVIRGVIDKENELVDRKTKPSPRVTAKQYYGIA